MATDPTTAIDQALADPASASSDGQSASPKSMNDVITGLNYGAMLVAIKKRRRGIRYTSLKNPGALDDCGRTTGTTFNGLY